MKITQRVKQAVQAFSAKERNAVGTSIGKQFLKNGNREPMVQDWSQVITNDKDLYTGYVHGALSRITGRGSYLAQSSVTTVANSATEEAAKKKDAGVEHPYLGIIDKSKDFTNYQFWSTGLRYLNLKGAWYILAVRTVEGERVGTIQEFKLLNPYNIERVWNSDHTKLAGYREYRNGMMRDIPPEMIIPVFLENPFDPDMPFSTLDAAKETQFTMKQAGDYTRQSLKNNISAPGIVSTDVELEDQNFINFRERVLSQAKGEPIFGNGAGAIKWEPMQIDMDKASLATINEINRDTLLAVTGVSKTTLNIEQSGVTRDSAKVQNDLFVTDTLMPQLQEIIDALNQDYKNNYTKDYEQFGYKLIIDSPLGKDKDAELKEIEVKNENFKLYTSLVNTGFDASIAAKYVDGKIEVAELGAPTNPPLLMPLTLPAANAIEVDVDEIVDEPDSKVEVAKHTHDHEQVIHNALTAEGETIVQANQAMLQNVITNIDARLVADCINRVTKAKNAFEDNSDLLTERQQREYEQELEFALGTFYGVILPLYAGAIMARRLTETGMQATFDLTPEVKKEMKRLADKGANSHVATVLDDILKTARESSLAGKTVDEIAADIRAKYNQTISEVRAKTIARTETNRAYTQSQYQADKQFLAQNDIDEATVYKQWITRSDDPCDFCLAMAARPPIKFNSAFADLGDTLEVVGEVNGKTKVSQLAIGYEPIEAGNLHPNCYCIYQLILEG